MEGKGLLFKIYAGIDVFDIEVNEKTPTSSSKLSRLLPQHSEVSTWKTSKHRMFRNRTPPERGGHPVMHDQHGTAIISSAGLLNALEVAGKKIEEVKIVVNGAGASATSCTKLYEALGARRENILMLDSKESSPATARI